MEEQTERFDTGGRALGWIGLGCSVGLLVIWFTQLGDPLPVPVLTGSIFFGLLFWAAIIRPAVLVVGDDLELRNMLETVRIPLAAIESHALRQVLAVRAGDKRYVGTGVGRSLRASALGNHDQGRLGQPGHVGDVGDSRMAIRGGGMSRVVDAADFVEARLADLAADARTRYGIERWSPEQIDLGRRLPRRRTWAVIVPLLVALVVFVASCLGVVPA